MSTASPTAEAKPAPSSAIPTSQPWRTAMALPLLVGPVWLVVLRWIGVTHPLASFAGGVLVLLLLVSCYTDLRWRRIFNWCTYTAALWGMLLATLYSLLPADILLAPEWPWRHALSMVSFRDGVLGFLLGFAVLYMIVSTLGGGAGDLKLVAAVGWYLGPDPLLEGLIVSFITAGVIAASIVTWKVGPVGMLMAGLARITMRFGFLPRWLASAPNLSAVMKMGMPMAPAFAIGFGCVAVLRLASR